MLPVSSTIKGGHGVDLALATSKSVMEMAKLLKTREERAADNKRLYFYLQLRCLLISGHVDRIRSLPPATQLIAAILEVFESLLDADEAGHRDPVQLYPRQEALNRGWNGLRKQGAPARLDFAERRLSLERCCGLRNYEKAFDAWEDEVEERCPPDSSEWRVDDDPPPKKGRTEPSYTVWNAHSRCSRPSPAPPSASVCRHTSSAPGCLSAPTENRTSTTKRTLTCF
jgi:hypothetical protein